MLINPEDTRAESMLRNLMRRFPKSYWPSFEGLSFDNVRAVILFLEKLDSRPFGLDEISDVIIRADITTIHAEVHVITFSAFGSGGEVWQVPSMDEARYLLAGYQVLKHCKEEAIKLVQTSLPPTYTIESGILHTTGGDDNWNGVVDLSQYEHFWWDQNVFKASKDTKTCLNLHFPNRDNLQEIKVKLLADITEALKEMKPCVKK